MRISEIYAICKKLFGNNMNVKETLEQLKGKLNQEQLDDIETDIMILYNKNMNDILEVNEINNKLKEFLQFIYDKLKSSEDKISNFNNEIDSFVSNITEIQ
jgi:ATP-dependent Lon protease